MTRCNKKDMMTAKFQLFMKKFQCLGTLKAVSISII